MENIKVRKDLNEIVESIRFVSNKSRFGVRHSLKVVLKDGTPTGKAIELRAKDTEMIYDAIQSYVTLGVKDFIKSKELVEELPTDAEIDGEVKPYICVKYVLTDDIVFRFFLERPQQIMVDNLYKLYKTNQKTTVKQG